MRSFDNHEDQQLNCKEQINRYPRASPGSFLVLALSSPGPAPMHLLLFLLSRERAQSTAEHQSCSKSYYPSQISFLKWPRAPNESENASQPERSEGPRAVEFRPGGAPRPYNTRPKWGMTAGRRRRLKPYGESAVHAAPRECVFLCFSIGF